MLYDSKYQMTYKLYLNHSFYLKIRNCNVPSLPITKILKKL